MIDLWDESFWLPPNTTWTDIENGPDKAVVYGSARDLLVQAPLAVTILTLRYIFERYVLKPLGKSLNISDKQNRRAPKNDVLEAEYRNLTNLKNLPSLAKKVDMSERQVERWWRLRRSQDKPSTLTKFCENMWKGTFYLVKESCVLVVLLGKKWFWNLDLCLDGHPHQGLTSDIWWYYMISSAFYWALIISQFWDVRRKDFWQMFVHHIATINFLSFSWICNLHRVGSIVLFTHEPSDIFLEFTKAARYAQFHRLAPVLFGTFVLVWIALRLYMFPVLILKPMLFSQPYYFPMFTFLKVLLCILMALNIMWTWFIVKAIFRTSMLGKSPEDTTSSSSENSDDSNVKNNLKSKIKNKIQ